MSRLFTILGLLLLLAWPACADVFTLWPGSDRATVREALHAKAVLSEAMTINGQPGTLEVSLSELSAADLAAALQTLLKDYKGARTGGTMMLESAPRDGFVTRNLVIAGGLNQQTVIFTMEVPVVKPTEDLRSCWPSSLPVPLGARIESVMALRERGTVYGLYATDSTAADAFSSYDTLLRSQSWRVLASDKVAGATYVSPDGKRLLLFSASDNDHGSRAAVYMHDVK